MWYRDQKHKTKVMCAKCNKVESAFFGNNQSRKTALIRYLTHNEFLVNYDETIITQIGVKLVDFKDRLDFPMYIRMFDTPGNAISHLKDEQSVFEGLDFVFIVLDGSKVIHKEHEIALNTYVIQRLMTYNQAVIKKEKTNMNYRKYIHDLMNETCDDSGNLISPEEQEQSNSFGHSYRQVNNIENNEEDLDDSRAVVHKSNHSEINNMNSQYTIQHNRLDTYKSIDSERNKETKGAKDYINLFRKKKTNLAMLPALFHIITKRDMLSDREIEDQLNRAKALKDENIIDQFFFISSKDQEGISEFLEGINERRLDILKEEQDEKDSIRIASEN